MSYLQFPGRVWVEGLERRVPHHDLTPMPSMRDWRLAGLGDDLLIEGDRLAAMNALLPTHGGKARCVVLTPPRTTGKQGWIYPDLVDAPRIADWGGQTVTRDDPERHDKWCCMMLPRLRGSQELLADDGAVLVSIGESDLHFLRLLMDEVFGADNFVTTVPRTKPPIDPGGVAHLSKRHEFIVVYAEDKARFRRACRRRAAAGSGGFRAGGASPGSRGAARSRRPPGHSGPAEDRLDDFFSTRVSRSPARRIPQVPIDLLRLCAGDDGLIVDVFAGTAATARAVLRLNGQDGGRRRFVLLLGPGGLTDRRSPETARPGNGEVPGGEVPDGGVPDSEPAGWPFGHYRAERSARLDAIESASRLPTYEDLADYLFSIATGQQVDRRRIRPDRWFVGSGAERDIYLIYSDDGRELERLGLDSRTARELLRTKRRGIVFAPWQSCDGDILRRLRITYRRIPLEVLCLGSRLPEGHPVDSPLADLPHLRGTRLPPPPWQPAVTA